MNSNLKYITFDSLMSSVESDLAIFADNNMIDRGKLIKVVRKVNADIGLKINKERETIIDIKNFKGELPADFMYLQLALGCHVEAFHLPQPSFGQLTVEHNEPTEVFHTKDSACLNECGGCYWVTQQFKDKLITFDRVFPLALAKRAKSHATDNCMNFHWSNSGYDIDIDYENSEVITPFREGKIYISYLADMVDDDNNILLLDHPLTTEYYEYAVTKKLLEMWMLNNDTDVSQKLMYIKNELKDARLRAMNFISTPEYSEISNAYESHRRKFYNKFSKVFETNY